MKNNLLSSAWDSITPGEDVKLKVKERIYLNEEKYQKNKKRLTKIAIAIMLIGVLIGGALIVTGIVRISLARQSSSPYRTNIFETESAKQADFESSLAELEASLAELETKQSELELQQAELKTSMDEAAAQVKENLQARLDELDAEEVQLQKQKTDEFRANNFSELYYELSNALEKNLSESTDIKGMLYKIENGWDGLSLGEPYDTIAKEYEALTEEYNAVSQECAVVATQISAMTNATLPDTDFATRGQDTFDSFQNNFDNFNEEFNKSFSLAKGLPFIMFGAFIIIASFMIGGYVLLIANGRNILAFGAQATVPVGKEVIEEMTPTMASSRGQVAEEVARGIRRGLSDEPPGTANTNAANNASNRAFQGQSPAPGRAQKSCPRCGAVAGTDSAFCDQCGKRL